MKHNFYGLRYNPLSVKHLNMKRILTIFCGACLSLRLHVYVYTFSCEVPNPVRKHEASQEESLTLYRERKMLMINSFTAE